MTSTMNIDALRMALSRRGGQAPALLHSDQGSQYAAADYQAMLKMHNIRCSMSRKGNCWDTQFKIPSNVQPNLTRAGIGEAAFALTCRLDTGVPRVSPGTLPVT
jgi:hypothetical protein